MRTRKPAAPSKGGPACHRCTALLHAGIERCSMCGWPAGVGYPPAAGELELAKTPVMEPEQEAAHTDEQAGAQLDALAGMAQRRNEPLPVRDDATASLEPVPALDEVPITEAPTEAGVDTDAEVDPLTGPIGALTEPGEPTSAAAPSTDQALEDPPAVTDTPLADVAAQVVAAGAVTAPSEEPLQVDDDVAPVAPEAPAAPPAPGRAASLARPTQLLIVSAAMLNLVLAGMQMAFGTPIDTSMTTVVLVTSLVALGVWTGAAVAFLHWVSRAYSHVASYSSYRQRHGVNMALGGWLIPIAGLLIGYRVLQDLWTGSDPATSHEADAKPASARVIDLWLLGLVTACIFAYGMPLALGDSALWSGIAALGVVTAGLALASVISTVSNWQTADAGVHSQIFVTTVAAGYTEGTVTTRVDDPETAAEPAGAPQSVSTSAE